ncbi:WYL domain-containing protein [Amphritea sp.]|uniref:WYL domain-containing protein n=1 Tax=Amphritea sp. TaxID=1872502 RepID=UPI003A8F150F
MTRISYQEAEHYRIIETFAQWEGRINTTYLQKILQISRQKASEIVGCYQNYAPDNLRYDASAKGYIPTADFQPRFTQGHIDEYGQLLARSGCIDYLSIFETGFCYLDAPLRNISPSLVQPIMRAIRDKLRIDIGYTSLSSPEYESRIISPHCLVFDGIRWHVRAHCGKNNDFRDFVLSRFNGEAEFEGPASCTAEQDERWNTWLDLIIQPDPRLAPQKRRLLELDYQMENGQRVISVRAALVMYLTQRLRLDHYDQNPEAQQIIIEPECLKRISQYLP